MTTDLSAPAAGPLSARRVVVVIATPLEAELVASVSAADDRLEVLFEPDLLPPLRFPCDHRGVDTFQRTDDQERRWQAMLARAEVLFGLPGDSGEGLADVVRANAGLRFVQATAGGAGQQVQAAGLSEGELARVLVTSAGGVHAGPLAEFAMFGVLAFTKGLPRLLAGTRARRWEHYPMAELVGHTVLVVGIGSVGAEVARLTKAFNMHVVAVNRSGRAGAADVDEIRPSRPLGDLLPDAHAVVITLPLTEETRGVIDAQAIGRMRAGAVLVNVGRGRVVDEDALVEALEQGRLSGAALDVFATEPLPRDSPLWRLPNVLISPQTAALSVHENERIVALFAEVGRVPDEMESGELSVAHLVLDLARLHVAAVVVGVGLQRSQCSQAAEREAGRDGERLQRDRQRVATEQADEPGNARSRDPGVEVILARTGPGELVVVVQAQAGEVVDGLAQRHGHAGVRRLDERRASTQRRLATS